MAVSITNYPAHYSGTGTGTHAIGTLTGVTAGSTIVALFGETAANDRSIVSVTSNNPTDTALTQVYGRQKVGASNQWAALYYLPNAAAGDHTITVVVSGSTTIHAQVVEIAGADQTAPLVTNNLLDDGAVTDTHYCAPTGSIDTTETDVAVVTVSIAVATTGTRTAHAQLTALDASAAWFMQFGYPGNTPALSTPLTDFRAEWTNTGTDRQFINLIAAFTGTGESGLSVSVAEVQTSVTF